MIGEKSYFFYFGENFDFGGKLDFVILEKKKTILFFWWEISFLRVWQDLFLRFWRKISFFGNIRFLRFWRKNLISRFGGKTQYYGFGEKSCLTVLARNHILRENSILRFWLENSVLQFWREILFYVFGRKSCFVRKLNFMVLMGNLNLMVWWEISFCRKTHFCGKSRLYGFDGKSQFYSFGEKILFCGFNRKTHFFGVGGKTHFVWFDGKTRFRRKNLFSILTKNPYFYDFGEKKNSILQFSKKISF